MKRRSRSSVPSADENARKAGSPSGRSVGRLWLFRIAAMVFVPLVLLGLLEVGLRVFGFGYPASFFVKRTIAGKSVFVENQQFGRRFFPLRAFRSPPATVMAANKAPHTYRIFVFGESAAMGDPEQAYGFWRYLQVLLQERFPESRFEVICAAMTGINSHAILPIARECAQREGDLWIVYTGNNEMIGPFGPGNPRTSGVPKLWFIRATLALRATKVGQLLDATGEPFAGRSKESWRGLAMFSEHQLRHSDREVAREHFEENVDAILRAAQKAGVKVILSTVTSNLRDCAPFASLHSAELSEAELKKWEQSYHEGVALESNGKFEEAIAKYVEAARLDEEYAELQFRLGHCYLAVTNAAQARRCFELARDFDALAFRTDSQLNRIIAQEAARQASQDVVFVDTPAILARFSADGVPGAELFYDHVHFKPEGNYLLARAMAEQLAPLLPASITKGDRGAWAPPSVCAKRLAISEWNRYHSSESMLQRISVPPFTSQLNHEAQTRMLRQELAELRSKMTPEAARQARENFQEAIALRPDDFLARRKFAEFLSAVGDKSEELSQWRQICGLLPHHPVGYFRLGQLLGVAGKSEEAEGNLREALRVRADFSDAWIELGKVLAQQQRFDGAVAAYSEALKLAPENAQAHYHLGNALLARNQRARAMNSLSEAVRLRPGFWEARYALGLELAREGAHASAQAQFSEVIRLRPEHADAHLNLGIALQKQGRTAEALGHFRESLRLDPSNAVAQEFIAKLQ